MHYLYIKALFCCSKYMQQNNHNRPAKGCRKQFRRAQRSPLSAPSSPFAQDNLKSNIIIEKLGNGATVVAQEHAGLDTAVVFAFPYGMRDDPYLPHFLEHLVFRSRQYPGSRSADQRIEMLGGCFNGYVSRDSLVLEVKVLNANLHAALGILKESLLEVPLSEEALQMEKRIILGELQDNRSEPTYRLSELRDSLFLGKEHPLYVPPETMPGVKSVTLEQLIHAKRQYLGAKDLYVGLAGPNIKRSLGALKEMLSSFPRRGKKKERFDISAPKGDLRTSRRRGIKDQVMFISFPVPGYGDPERYAMDILTNLLVGTVPEHQSRARIWEKLREKEGLIYSPLVDEELYPGAGLLEISIHGILKGKVKKVQQLVLQEFEKITAYPIGRRQLEGARESIILNAYRKRDRVDEVAEKMALLAGGGENTSFKAYCKGLSEAGATEALSVAKKYLSPEKLFVVMLEPA